MQEEINNKISQFVDDELDLQQSLLLIQSANKNVKLKNKIYRYQAISQVLKYEQPVLLQADFADRISKQIKEEPVYFIPARKSVITWKKTSLAVAASLLLIAVLLPKLSKQTPSDHSSNLVVAERLSVQTSEQKRPDQPLVRVQRYPSNQRFNDYLQAHSNSIYTIGASNYQPYARVAGYSQER